LFKKIINRKKIADIVPLWEPVSGDKSKNRRRKRTTQKHLNISFGENRNLFCISSYSEFMSYKSKISLFVVSHFCGGVSPLLGKLFPR